MSRKHHDATLPHPPTDAERDSYWDRSVRWLVVGSSCATATILVAATHLTLTVDYYLPYLVIVLFMATVAAISISCFAQRSRTTKTRHRAIVDAWLATSGRQYPSVDVWLPICGEPLEILANAWSAVSKLRWPGELRVTVVDDGDDERASDLARSYGFDYRVRGNRPWMKKAGNLQFAYETTHNDLVLILDADFCPRPDMLTELAPYFDEDDALGIVQSPQYFETTPAQSWMQRGAGSVQELFYRAIQPGRDRHRAACCVGTCAMYRRAALVANGGTTVIGHSEDVHTGFDLGALGWGLHYVPVVLAMGVCPWDIDSFFKQQYRWCMGSMSLLTSRKFWRAKMPIRGRLCYIAGFGYYAGTALVALIGPALPASLLAFEPGIIHLANYVFLAPMYLWVFLVFPRWHKLRFGPEAWTVQLLYSWAHLFAIADKLRGRPVGWTATNTAERVDRADAMRVVLACWPGLLGAAWFTLAGYYVVSGDVNFIPILLLGGWFLTVVGRVFCKDWGHRMMRRVALAVVLMLSLLSSSAYLKSRAEPTLQLSAAGPTAQYGATAERTGPVTLGSATVRQGFHDAFVGLGKWR